MHRTLVRPRLRFMTAPTTDAPTPGAPAPAAPAVPATPAAVEPAKATEPLGAPGLKALQDERDARAAAEKALADLTKQIEDSKKTAEQKTADDLAAAQRDAADASLRALRYEVAAEKGLDLKLAGRLNGSTKDELAADAEALKTLIPAGPTGPKPDRSQGGGGSADKGTSVAAGRDLYAERHPQKS